MGEFLHIVFSIFATLSAIETALYFYVKSKRSRATKGLKKKIKENTVIYLILFSLFCGWLYFFEERSSYLECQKDAMTCRYFHTTYSNKKMRVIETYDISQVAYARPKRNFRASRHSNTFYTVELVEKNKKFSLAPHFHSINTASKEASRFNHFLRGEKNVYTLRNNPSSDSFGSIAGFMGFLFAIFLEIRLFWDLVVAAFNEHKKAKSSENKKTLPNDDVIQRSR